MRGVKQLDQGGLCHAIVYVAVAVCKFLAMGATALNADGHMESESVRSQAL